MYESLEDLLAPGLTAEGFTCARDRLNCTVPSMLPSFNASMTMSALRDMCAPAARTKLVHARGEGAKQFLYQIVSAKEADDITRQFIGFRSAGAYWEFFTQWAFCQLLPDGQQTSLLEVGPDDPARFARKWVMDIDAPREALEQFGYLTDALQMATDAGVQLFLNTQVITFTKSVIESLGDIGFFGEKREACRFAITTRHRFTEDMRIQKLSWHITLLALAPYPAWRAAMRHVEHCCFPAWVAHAQKSRSAPLTNAQLRSPWCAAVFYDFCISANSKGQYIQTLYSTKVPVTVKQPHAFVFHGMFAPDGQRAKYPFLDDFRAQFLATSIAMPDPWSVRGVPVLSLTAPSPSTKRPREHHQPQACALKMDGHAAQLPDTPWLTDLVVHASGDTVLTAKSDDQYLSAGIRDAIRNGNLQTICYFHVANIPCCWRTLVHESQVRRHANNRNGLIYCGRDTDSKSLIVFAACFSEKCRPHEENRGFTWVELQSKHRALLRKTATKQAAVTNGERGLLL